MLNRMWLYQELLLLSDKQMVASYSIVSLVCFADGLSLTLTATWIRKYLQSYKKLYDVKV